MNNCIDLLNFKIRLISRKLEAPQAKKIRNCSRSVHFIAVTLALCGGHVYNKP